MKKKLITLLACVVLGAAVVTGCGGTGGSIGGETHECKVVIEEASLPPLEDEMKELYRGAYEIYSEINFGLLEYDEETTMEKDGFTYYKVTDGRFKSYDDFQKYLLQYFTENFVNGNILSPENIMFIKGEDGGLYTLGGGRGTNIYYAGHTFTMDKESEEEIGFKATAYYTNSNEPYSGDYIYKAPENAEDYTTQDYLFVLWNDAEIGWRFNTFYLFF